MLVWIDGEDSRQSTREMMVGENEAAAAVPAGLEHFGQVTLFLRCHISPEVLLILRHVEKVSSAALAKIQAKNKRRTCISAED